MLNLKTKEGLKKARDLILESDVLLDPYRPGVLEKLDLDPVQLLQVHYFTFSFSNFPRTVRVKISFIFQS